jgi:glycosyltransferase involved in cell wall biosynthesis
MISNKNKSTHRNMISIIICTRHPEKLKKVSASIAETIGVPFEIVAVDNVQQQYGICEAYNIGASRARYDFFCFMHDDIHFETRNWGARMIAHLSDPGVGLIGVIGGDPKLKLPAINNVPFLKVEGNVVGYNKSGPVHYYFTEDPEDKSIIKPVTAVDGIWMCTRREVYEQFRFDDITFKHFHGYDIDYSLQVISAYKVCVVFDILLHHYSPGSPDRYHVREKLKLNRKWRKKTPISCRPYSSEELTRLHWIAMANFMNHLFNLQYGTLYIMRLHCYFSMNRFFRLRPFLSILKRLMILKIHQRFPMRFSLKDLSGKTGIENREA